ncbi:MAG: helix-turn-helix domain-containing protein [Desulfarculaceae bacterium]|nr:helix-turn-helix domain-containing protein [Desulfarculaceae bacterium]MCF8074203.1 helix-turn-helix domain-containing protein [Desulfarculaceae bacterium]MCF8102784.1 helix-turn-helix domain-containing protein [Desulfarculaceae bacterium]MCF8116361.1 helix-turn-helix domain-containing protein [Desulfarculaceae bacterium]
MAAKHPRLHPTRRMVLKAVAALCADGVWATSSDIRERTDLSQQLLNRHLRGLESEGLIRIEKPGPGLPLNVITTPLGLRLLGHAEAPRDIRPEPEVEPEAPAQAPEPDSELSALAKRLYQQLEDHLLDLDRRQIEQLLRRALGKAAMATAAAPAAPQIVEEEPEVDFGLQPEPEAEAPPVVEAVVESEPELEPPAQPRPPQLTPAEATLEEKLLLTARADYRNIIWWQRTRDLSEIWDRARRRQLGLLNTYFTSFRPRWEYSEWEDFNLARRQADARGASYGDWIEAQFEKATQEGRNDVQPSELHGDKAIKAYLGSDSCVMEGQPMDLSQPPYDSLDAFDLDDPAHVAYATALLDQLKHLSKSVYGSDPLGPVNLLVEAVLRGNLPMEALALQPEYRTAVLVVLQREHPDFLALQNAPGQPQARQAQPQGRQAASSAGSDVQQTSVKPPLII